jgi:pyroglutamyl-peptidase
MNSSWEIVSRLPAMITESYPRLRIVTPNKPLKVIYQEIASTIPKLVEQHHPDIAILMGLAAERNYFAVEKSAFRDGYHQIPDEDRKVVTKAESKKLWGRSPESLETSLDIDDLVSRWKMKVKSCADVRASDDVGIYACGFAYYHTLERCRKEHRAQNVLFFHVPPLKTEKEVENGVKVTLALMQSIAESIKK